MCRATLPRAACPVSGGSGSPLSYQAKTRVSSAGAHSHSLILLRCTLKEPSSGAKQRQPANLTTPLPPAAAVSSQRRAQGRDEGGSKGAGGGAHLRA